jgi:hypothetical protein
MAVRCGFENLLRDKLAEGRLALGVARGAEAALLARKGKEVLVAAVGTANVGKAPGRMPQR